MNNIFVIDMIAFLYKYIKKKLNVLKAVAFATYKEWSVYRSHSLVSVFVGPVYFLVQIFIWKAIYSSKGSINEFNLDQMITYFAIAALLNYMTMDFADWNLQMLIHTGKFISFMLRPMSHVYFAFSQKVGHRILGFLFEFIPVYLLITWVFKVKLIPKEPFWAILSILLGFIMLFFINYCVGITGFWLTRTSGIRRMFLLLRDICSGVLIPLMLFPGGIQKIFFFLPFQYTTYVPVRVFIGSYELAGVQMKLAHIVGVQAAATILMGLFTLFFYKQGIKKYSGVGV